jgi:hypothetical protein
MIGTGFLEARSASREARTLFSSFDGDICRSDWQSAYSRMDAPYRASRGIAEFRKSILPDAPPNIHMRECNGTMGHLWRQPERLGWKAEFDQVFVYDSGFNKNQCTAHSSPTGWVIDECASMAAKPN